MTSSASSISTGQTAQPIAAGYVEANFNSGHSCARRSNGSAMCWGGNWDGELGIGSSGNHSPVPVNLNGGISNIVALGAGLVHSCALRSDGTVSCWGGNYSGQIGHGGGSIQNTPATVSGLSGATALSSATYYNCALSAGKAYCWGDTPLGPLPTATQATSLSDLTAIAAGTFSACAVRADTTVSCWGSNSGGQLGNAATGIYLPAGIGPQPGLPSSSSIPITVQVVTSVNNTTGVVQTANLSGITNVAAGERHICALRNNGTVVCWGDNNRGALGATSTAPWLSPNFSSQTSAIVVDNLSSVTRLAAGKAFNCALLSDSTVKCWGDNSFGQLGNGSKTTIAQKTPVTVTGLSGAIAIAAGEAHACALLADGKVKCWGGNGLYGNLGNNSTLESLSPIETNAGAVFGN